jgi:ubiquinol-cytochrome c reductase cytochrome b subunit
LLPPIAYVVTYWTCLGLQQNDRRILEHGVETGIITRLPHGAFVEVHQPLDGNGDRLTYQGAPVPTRMNQLGAAGQPKPGGLFHPDPDDETAALHHARQRSGATEGELTGEDSKTRPADSG